MLDYFHIALPSGNVVAPALLRWVGVHLADPRGPAAHVAVAAQLQPLARLPVCPSRQHRQQQNPPQSLYCLWKSDSWA